MSRQPSVAGPPTTPSNTTPPALEQMTGVFSLSDSTQPKQRVRRKMTEAEKMEYRKRRIIKACDKCSKRKRKVCRISGMKRPFGAATDGQAVQSQPARDGEPVATFTEG